MNFGNKEFMNFLSLNFGNKEFSQLQVLFPSLAAKNIINLISVLTIW